MDGLEEHVTSLTASAGAVLAQKWRAHPEQVVTSTVVVGSGVVAHCIVHGRTNTPLPFLYLARFMQREGACAHLLHSKVRSDRILSPASAHTNVSPHQGVTHDHWHLVFLLFGFLHSNLSEVSFLPCNLVREL